MPAALRLTGILKQNYNAREDILLMEFGQQVCNILLEKIGLDKKELEYLVVVNGTLRDETYIPNDGDKIEIIPLVAAG